MRRSSTYLNKFILKSQIYYGSENSKKRMESNREETLRYSKALTSEYIDDRLIRSGLNMKQRKISDIRHSRSTDDVFPPNLFIRNDSKERYSSLEEVLKTYFDKRCKGTFGIDDLIRIVNCMGECLELRHASVYTDILHQLNMKTVVAEKNLKIAFMQTSEEIFTQQFTWAKMLSLLAFAGGLAVDCVLHGSPSYVAKIKHWTNEYIENYLLDLILMEGGWVGKLLQNLINMKELLSKLTINNTLLTTFLRLNDNNHKDIWHIDC